MEDYNNNWIHEFENLYILSYQTLYRHASLLFNQEEKIKELLILTYSEAYQRESQLTKEKDPISWLLKRCDFLAESKMNVTKDMLEASYAEERMQSKEAKKEKWSKLDETSVLLEIEEALGIEDEHESADNKGIAHTVINILCALMLVSVAIFIILNGGIKIKNRVDNISRPVILPLEEESLSQNDFDGEATENHAYAVSIQVGSKAAYLSGTGQVLYTLPLEESNIVYTEEKNPEIQKQAGWIYYLPCRERSDTQLINVSPFYNHVLYRMNTEGLEIEIIAREVEDYNFWEDGIYILQFGHVKRIDADQIFDKEIPGIYVKEIDDDLYLYDSLGRTLETDADGSIFVEDRILKMSSDKILDVQPAPRKKGQTTFFLKRTEDDSDIYQSRNGREELFESNNGYIDSFCIVGDWIYYSCSFIEEGSHYSEIYRRSVTREGKTERLAEGFAGKIYQMYYSSESRMIYADYVPKSWKNNHGLIAVIDLDGQISYLDDDEYRNDVETTGNDWLRFVMIQDGNVYCYWEDCFWKKNEMPEAMWRKVVVIPNDKRIPLE